MYTYKTISSSILLQYLKNTLTSIIRTKFKYCLNWIPYHDCLCSLLNLVYFNCEMTREMAVTKTKVFLKKRVKVTVFLYEC